MSRLHLRRPSTGLVLAAIALFVALGGGAYAATSDTKTDKKIAKKAAKNYFNGHIGGASVSHANTAASANSATNATQLGGQPASSFESSGNIMFASVATSATGATVVRGQGATGAGRIATGAFFVTFNRPIAGCTWLATYGVTGDGGSGSLFVTVEGRNFSTAPNDVEVRERTDAGAQTDGAGFHIEVLCP
jgi:hypothetical protein